MIKKIPLLILFLTVVSCGIQYDGETRLVLETAVKDRNGNALENVAVGVTFNDGNFGDMISDGVTDKNGNLLLIFPAAVNDSIDISISIHSDDLELQDKTYRNVMVSDFENYKLTINPILYALNDIVNLNIVYHSISLNSYIQNVRVEGLQSGEDEYFHPTFYDSYTPTNFRLIKNQNVVLKYDVIDSSGTTENAVPLSIGNEDLSYTITY